MIELTTPRSQDPSELYRWVMDFVQRFMAQQREGGTTAGSSVGVVSGGATWWPLAAAPAGHVGLSGQVLDQSSFPILYSIYGALFNTGGEAVGTFRLPNMNGRVPKHGSTGTGGAASQVLGLAHLPDLALDVTDPQHTHVFTGTAHTHTVTDPQHTHGVTGDFLIDGGTTNAAVGAVPVMLGSPTTILPANAATGLTVNNATAAGTNASSSTGISVQLSGGGEAVVIDPPWLGGLWIVRAE